MEHRDNVDHVGFSGKLVDILARWPAKVLQLVTIGSSGTRVQKERRLIQRSIEHNPGAH